jgi:hypothetical protein
VTAKGRVAVMAMVLAACTGSAAAQLDFRATGSALKIVPADPQISAALQAISAAKIHEDIQKLVAFRTRNTLSSMAADLPDGTGVTAAEQWLKSQYEAYSRECGGCLEVKEDTFIQEPPEVGFDGRKPRILKATKLTSIYAVLKGTDPAQAKRMYLVTGHYDSRATDVMDPGLDSPGANDDASGTAVSMESARVLSKLKFPATLVFVTVPGEEQGLYGSKHLAQLARKEGWDLEGVLNNDIVGGNTTPGEKLQSKALVRVFSENVPASASADMVRRLLAIGAESDSPSRELAREVLDVSRTYFPIAPNSTQLKPVMEMRLDRYLRGGDHRSFNEEGFAAVRFTEWREDYNHQHQTVRTENGVEYGDLIKFDDFNYISQVARLNAATLATLAKAPGQPKNVRMLTDSLDNNSIMVWEAPDGSPVDTWYQIVWRETAAADWQYGGTAAAYGEAVTGVDHKAAVPISKDNVLFGIRACDAKGHCSPAVLPN